MQQSIPTNPEGRCRFLGILLADMAADMRFKKAVNLHYRYSPNAEMFVIWALSEAGDQDKNFNIYLDDTPETFERKIADLGRWADGVMTENKTHKEMINYLTDQGFKIQDGKLVKELNKDLDLFIQIRDGKLAEGGITKVQMDNDGHVMYDIDGKYISELIYGFDTDGVERL
jgi:hypothetical protein